jgi:hypothetical protein
VSSSVALYRVVSPQELADLRSERVFRTTPGHIEAKQFWTDPEDAERYLRRLERMGLGPNHVVEVRIRAADLARVASIYVDSRPARCVDEADLTWFNECVVNIVLPETEALDG